MEYGKYRELMIYHAKELGVKHMLMNNNFEFIHDKPIIGGKSRFRPDFLIRCKFGYIVIEVDEEQHKRYTINHELNRMGTIYNDVQCTLSRAQVLFIRYNPDCYKSELKQKFDIKDRLGYLHLVTNHFMSIDNIGTQLGCVKLFYDGFNCSPQIDIISTILDSLIDDEHYDNYNFEEDNDLEEDNDM